jgi:hypothetical protein
MSPIRLLFSGKCEGWSRVPYINIIDLTPRSPAFWFTGALSITTKPENAMKIVWGYFFI